MSRDPSPSFAARRSRRSTAGNRMAAVLLEEKMEMQMNPEYGKILDDDDGEYELAGDGGAGADGGASEDDDLDMEDDSTETSEDEAEGAGGAAEGKPTAKDREVSALERPKRRKKMTMLEMLTKRKRARGEGPSASTTVASEGAGPTDAPPNPTAPVTPTTPTTPTAAIEEDAPADSPGSRRKQRVSWVRNQPEARLSTRAAAQRSRARMEARQLEREKERERTQPNRRRSAAAAAPGLTQAERLRIAAETEAKNRDSLGRWQADEMQKAKERRARIRSLRKHVIEGPRMTMWSTRSVWAGGRSYLKMSIEEVEKREEERRKEDAERLEAEKKAALEQEERDKLAKQEGEEEGGEKTEDKDRMEVDGEENENDRAEENTGQSEPEDGNPSAPHKQSDPSDETKPGGGIEADNQRSTEPSPTLVTVPTPSESAPFSALIAAYTLLQLDHPAVPVRAPSPPPPAAVSASAARSAARAAARERERDADSRRLLTHLLGYDPLATAWDGLIEEARRASGRPAPAPAAGRRKAAAPPPPVAPADLPLRRGHRVAAGVRDLGPVLAAATARPGRAGPGAATAGASVAPAVLVAAVRPPMCPVTNKCARYRDPVTGLAYRDRDAFKCLRGLVAERPRDLMELLGSSGEESDGGDGEGAKGGRKEKPAAAAESEIEKESTPRWYPMVSAYVPSTCRGRVADGVPEGFL